MWNGNEETMRRQGANRALKEEAAPALVETGHALMLVVGAIGAHFGGPDRMPSGIKVAVDHATEAILKSSETVERWKGAAV